MYGDGLAVVTGGLDAVLDFLDQFCNFPVVLFVERLGERPANSPFPVKSPWDLVGIRANGVNSLFLHHLVHEIAESSSVK